MRRERGFTLIEVMVVLAIVGLIAGLGTRGLRSLAKSDLRRIDGAPVGRDALPVRPRLHDRERSTASCSTWRPTSTGRRSPTTGSSSRARRSRSRRCGGARRRRPTRTTEEQKKRERAAKGRRQLVVPGQLQLRSLEARGRRLQAQARALRGLQGGRDQAGEAQEGEAPQRLHAPPDRTAHQRTRVHLFLPARPDRARDRHAVGRSGSDPSTPWWFTRSRAASASTTRRFCRQPAANAPTTRGTRVRAVAGAIVVRASRCSRSWSRSRSCR